MAKRRRSPGGDELLQAKAAVADAQKALAAVVVSLLRLEKADAGAETVAPSAPVSRQRRAALKLHGAYIGHLRHLEPRQKAQVQAVKAKKGYEAAISMAKGLTTLR